MSAEDEKEEKEIIFSLDSYVILEYIKSSVDIILNLKFEEIEKKLIDKNGTGGAGKKKENRLNEETINSPNIQSSTRSYYSS